MIQFSKKVRFEQQKTSNTKSLKAFLFVAVVFLTTLFSSTYAQAQTEKKSRKKILIVVSSQDKKGDFDVVAGFWFPELTHPIKVYYDEGYDFDIASPKGGLAPFDGFDLTDPVNKWFWTNPALRNKLGNTIKLSDVDVSKYNAIEMVGGHGPMFDFYNNKELHDIARKIYEKNGIVSAVCHGPAGLINLKLSNGNSLIKGKRITGFSKAEEDNLQATKFIPFELEPKLVESGAIYEKAEQLFGLKVCVDSRIVSGQNPTSAKAFGEAVIAEIKKIEKK